MSELPRGWVEATLEDLCEFNPKHDPETDRATTVSFIPMPAVDDETGAIVDRSAIRPLSEVWKGYTHFSDADVIFAKITPCMENGKIAVARGLENGMACGSTEFHVLRSMGAVEPDFVWRFLRQRSYRQVAERSMTGAVGQRRVPKPFLEGTILPLPPLAEQKRIVAKLDTLNAKSARARTELARIETLVSRYKQAVLSKAFSGELTRDMSFETKASIQRHLAGLPASQGRKLRRGVDQVSVRPQYLENFDVPDRWVETYVADLIRLGAIWDVKDGNHGANHPTKDEFSAAGLPFITADRVIDGEIAYDEAAKLSGAPLARLRVGFSEPDDVILTHKGTVGRVALATEKSVLSPQTTYYRLNKSAFLPKYFVYFLQSPYLSRQLDDVKSQTTRDFVPIARQYELFVLVPELAEQHEIVRRIESAFAKIDRLAKEAKRGLELLGRLDEAILAKAFRGDLVPQDENDEPAELLLARIRAERDKAPKARHGRKAVGQ